MSEYEKKQLERDFRLFITRQFEKPSRCKNLGQIQYYVKELSIKISDYKSRFNHVPDYAYTLLNDYNMSQNKLIFKNFRREYSY